ncbi:hypothetical protein B0A48_04488 [Cryoendolithus antarcticus]|uniref:Phosphatidylinositol N-acetylglucosaminyltransferase subunit H conserved domain-containing protein n=1 Tax=Cryoendolithus antarcticus TaxID=1507870 RepID=A0A1V8TFW3_9PEZI|nr:hypothetical protein B0A48_04488 [Cryoendolithus antarcticus]
MLTTKRPTPTTIEYTVSTRPSTPTLSSRIAASVSTLLRLATAAISLGCLLVELGNYFDLHLVDLTRVWQSFTPLPTPPALYRFPIYVALLVLTLRRPFATDSLLVIQGLGLQTSTSSPTYLWSGTTRFIPTSQVQDVFLHEAFRGFEVVYYLSVVVEGEGEVVVVFPTVLPRREILEEVWRGVRSSLYELKG